VRKGECLNGSPRRANDKLRKMRERIAILQAKRRRGVATIVGSCIGAKITLLVSVALMVEYEAVMTGARHLVASKLSAEEVGILLDAVASVGEPVRPVFLWRPMCCRSDMDRLTLNRLRNHLYQGL